MDSRSSLSSSIDTILPEIKQGILAKYSLGRRALKGSAVGSIVQKVALERLGYKLDIRSGGIVDFVSRNLADTLSVIPDAGGTDFLFEILSTPLEITSHPTCGIGSGNTTERTFWRAFTNPTLDLDIRVDTDFDKVLFPCPDSDSSLENTYPLARINAVTQYSWALEYAEQNIPETFKAAALTLLDDRTPDDFSGKWITFLRHHELPGHASKWEQFRVTKASDALDKQLVDLGCPEEKRQKLVGLLTRSQTASKKTQPEKIAPSFAHVSTNTQKIGPPESALLRAIARYAAEHAPIDRLRELNVPLSIIDDFFQKYGWDDFSHR